LVKFLNEHSLFYYCKKYLLSILYNLIYLLNKYTRIVIFIKLSEVGRKNIFCYYWEIKLYIHNVIHQEYPISFILFILNLFRFFKFVGYIKDHIVKHLDSYTILRVSWRYQFIFFFKWKSPIFFYFYKLIISWLF